MERNEETGEDLRVADFGAVPVFDRPQVEARPYLVPLALPNG